MLVYLMMGTQPPGSCGPFAPSRVVRFGFALAAFYNFCIIAFSRFFSSNLGEIDPLFSREGCFCILLWGCAYLSIGGMYDAVPWTSAVFCVEKLFYGVHWVLWLLDHNETGRKSLRELFASDPLVGMFYAVYGAGDILFALFFYRVFQNGIKRFAEGEYGVVYGALKKN